MAVSADCLVELAAWVAELAEAQPLAGVAAGHRFVPLHPEFITHLRVDADATTRLAVDATLHR